MSEPCPIESEPEPHGILASGPSGGLTPPPGMSPLAVSSLLDISLAGTPLMRHLFSDFLAIHSQRKQAFHLTITPRGSMSVPKKLRQGPDPTPLRVTETHPNWLQKLKPVPALNKDGENLPVLPAPPPVPLSLVWEVEPRREILRVLWIWLCPAQNHPRVMGTTQTWTLPLGIVSHAQTQMMHLCKLPARGTGREHQPPAS